MMEEFNREEALEKKAEIDYKLHSDNEEKASLKHPQQTMNERYGDGSNHGSCGICGFCVDCGDCRAFGCTSDNWDDSQSKQNTNNINKGDNINGPLRP